MVQIVCENASIAYKVQAKGTSILSRTNKTSADPRLIMTGSSGEVRALDGVTFTLKEGDRLGLVGGNGAGKTTLLKLIYGVLTPSAGRVSVRGSVDALFNINLGFRPCSTGRRNILLRGLINGWSKADIERRMDEIIAFSELDEFIDLPFNTYSQGMAARLAFSVATALDPEILLMDEWLGAGDPSFQEKAAKRMEEITARAGIIVLASHNGNLIRRTCNKILELKRGHALPICTIDEWNQRSSS
ncbi:ABC transporter ATP-binding protein [Simiduia sp. 21SJ11W-1]|uniref:ABC transporter ATP-binding protein n=1 Tax=Simiduia sp. 21SJ11W-1 TaxID=2909669 RepID=UPI0020A11F1D|nr:ABC transporter ATP-binding protein [Simiduia sp. 21SJ11W-1]UTA49539.1 ABC transporter ATP-binding protein [Simiduia sp. 21SJ11W-1]